MIVLRRVSLLKDMGPGPHFHGERGYGNPPLSSHGFPPWTQWSSSASHVSMLSNGQFWIYESIDNPLALLVWDVPTYPYISSLYHPFERASYPVIFKINKGKHKIDAVLMTLQHDSWHWSQHLIDSPPSLATLARVLNQDSSLQRGAVDGGAWRGWWWFQGASSPRALEQAMAISHRINEYGKIYLLPIALIFFNCKM